MTLPRIATYLFCISGFLVGCGGGSSNGKADTVIGMDVADTATGADATDTDTATDTTVVDSGTDTVVADVATDTATDTDDAVADTDVGPLLEATFALTFSNGASTLSAPAGDTVPFTASFDIKTNGCASCLVQVLVAVAPPATLLPNANMVPQLDVVRCIYNGGPGAIGKKGTHAGDLVGSQVRDYPIYMAAALTNNCDDAIAAYHARSLTPELVGTLTATPAPERVSFVRIAGGGERNDVAAGSYFDVMLDYNVFERCSGCQTNLTLGVDDVGQACVYAGAAGPSPGVDGTTTVRLRAPNAASSSEITWGSTQDGTCGQDAVSRFAGLIRAISPSGGTLINAGTRLCLDMPQSTMANSAPLSNFSCGDTDNQRFNFVYLPATDDWQIHLAHSDLCLDVEASGSPNGARILQYTCGDTPNQRWTLHTEKGLLALRPRHTEGAGGCLTAGDGQSGSTVTLMPCADQASAPASWDLQHFSYGFLNE